MVLSPQLFSGCKGLKSLWPVMANLQQLVVVAEKGQSGPVKILFCFKQEKNN